MSSESVQKELSRLCDGDALPKLEIDTAILFPTIEKNIRSSIDREIKMPSVHMPYFYLSDEGFLIVFTVLYSLSRAACAELFVKTEENGEHAFLILEGKTDKKASSTEDALALPTKTLATLSSIAKASGFSLSITVDEGTLRVRFSFVRFRAVPISAYSCSEDFVLDKMHRAFRLFMHEGSNFFDIETKK